MMPSSLAPASHSAMSMIGDAAVDIKNNYRQQELACRSTVGISPAASRIFPSNAAILEKIMQIREEMELINLHQQTHSASASEARKMGLCKYCHVNPGSASSQDSEDHSVEAPLGNREKQPGQVRALEGKSTSKKNAAVQLNELERAVSSTGKNGQVIVPKTWIGKRVRIVLMS